MVLILPPPSKYVCTNTTITHPSPRPGCSLKRYPWIDTYRFTRTCSQLTYNALIHATHSHACAYIMHSQAHYNSLRHLLNNWHSHWCTRLITHSLAVSFTHNDLLVCTCLYVCMCARMYVCTYLRMYVCLSLCLYVCMSLWISANNQLGGIDGMYVFIYACMAVCMYVSMYVCVSICMFVSMYVYMSLCI